ncbi:hypothetical protein NQZ79_g282 [Umbelopsis isabellina]|nr:hypothetical protein NQZ79_g282 [Umbelopsis isabellina]
MGKHLAALNWPVSAACTPKKSLIDENSSGPDTDIVMQHTTFENELLSTQRTATNFAAVESRKIWILRSLFSVIWSREGLKEHEDSTLSRSTTA